MPIISTLKDLIKTGDEVLGIEGVFSGTLSYIFNSFVPGKTFSEIVSTAKQLGYTEPDPRDDLSGMDVARKVIILAREMGLKKSLADVSVKSLIPADIANIGSVDEFMQRLSNYDKEMQDLLLKSQKENKCLRYVGLVDPNRGCHVELKAYDNSHPFAGLSGGENIILFKTRRYNEYPLIVRGPGAGAEVTAAGVFSDLTRLCDILRGSS